jgi:hypothetical protein
MIYRKFKIDKELGHNLSQEDLKIVKVLEEAVMDIGKVYEQQIKKGFYPKNITKKQIEDAAVKTSQLISPFTVVKEKDGKLEAIPYHEEYAEYLKPIATKINKASEMSSNPSLKKYLKARAKSLVDGSYRDADIAWFDLKNSSIDFNIGPFERYQDKLLFCKRTFQGHVGIIDRVRTDEANRIREVLYSSAKMSSGKYHSTDIPKKGVSLYVEDTPITSGYIADALFSGEHFPSDFELLSLMGSRIIFYRSQLLYKFEKIHYPIFKAIFEKRFASKYPKQLLIRATVRNIFLYELGKQLHQFEGARDRLKELYGIIDEANGFASGIQHSKHLVVKGIMDQDLLEATIIMHIVWMFTDWLSHKSTGALESYVKGDSILLNAYLNSGALKEHNGISWPNFSRLFFEIENVADTLVDLLRNGSYKNAENYINKNADLKNFEKLAKNLKTIRLDV